MSRLIGVNENGHRVGEDHPRAKLTNSDVERVFELRDGGWTYLRIAEAMECSKSQIRNIIKGFKRCQQPVRFKRCT